MKVLHINSYYSVSSFYKNLYKEQIKKGLDIDVYVPVAKNIDTSSLDLGEFSYISKNHGKYDRVLFSLKHSKIYKDIIKTYDISSYDLIHAHSLFSNGFIAYKLYKEYGIPYIVAVRNTDINVFFSKMIHLRQLGVNILKNAKEIIFISETYKKHVLDKYIDEDKKEDIFNKSTTIPNGIDKFWLENKYYDRSAPDKGAIKLLYVGIIDKNKNIGTTIEACKKLIEEGYKINYTIIGKIKDESFNNMIEKNSFIEYIPHISKEELIEYYRESDIFVMPSKHETFGLVYLEAMSQGMPVIYTKGQGFDGRFEDGEVGFSVKYDDDEEIFNRIKDIVKDYSKISKGALENVDNFSWERITELYSEIY
ncbi:MAG: glycosyltransferase family 4 protein [Tissierella sp.]|uniref:glycosyltransferase family 4 protein n=1 Tax=Tissierella sp. TaxID=41274 RepID=UPI003F96AD3C